MIRPAVISILTLLAACSGEKSEPKSDETAETADEAAQGEAAESEAGQGEAAEGGAINDDRPGAAETSLGADPESALASEADASPEAPAGIAIEAVDACFLKLPDLAATLGDGYAAGEAFQIIPQTRSCRYENAASQLRINITWIDPQEVEVWRKQMTTALAGSVSRVLDDADSAAFQIQPDIDTCALYYVRQNLQYEIRLMNCPEDPEGARAKLLALPRPN